MELTANKADILHEFKSRVSQQALKKTYVSPLNNTLFEVQVQYLAHLGETPAHQSNGRCQEVGIKMF